MPVPIEAVLFDFGGVFTASPFHAIDEYAAKQGADPAALLDVIFGSYDVDTDHPWHRCERGELTMADTVTEIAAAAAAAGMRFDPIELFGGFYEADPYDRTLVVECVRKLRARGIRTAIVTNNIREYGPTWRATIPVDELFDAVVDSCEVGVRKPNPAIYQLTLDRLKVDDPAGAVFLDDYHGNVDAARAHGMHGIVVGRDPQPALAALEALLDELG